MKAPLPQAGGRQSSPGLLSSPWIFTPFLVNPTPHVSPTNLRVWLKSEHLNEVLEVGKWAPATSFSGWKEGHGERFRPPGKVALGCVLPGAMGY